MGRFVGIEVLKQAVGAAEARDVAAALIADPGVLGVVALHLLAFTWLAHRFTARSRSRRRSRLHQGARVAGGLFWLLGAVVFLALGLLLAVARSAGRSTFHSGARF